MASASAPWQTVTTKVNLPGRPQLRLDSVTRVQNSGLVFSGPLAKDLQTIMATVNGTQVPITITIPRQIVSVAQSGITGLQLTGDDAGRFVYVTDFYHMLAWNGTAFSFTDGGSNYYSYSDHGPPAGVGWVPCQGQVVTYLLENGKTATKTLQNTRGEPGFLQLGTGAGVWVPPVAPTITGSVTVTGTCSITGTCTVTVTVTSGGNTGTGTATSGTGVTTVQNSTDDLGNSYSPISVLGHTPLDGSASVGTAISGSAGFTPGLITGSSPLSGTGDWTVSDLDLSTYGSASVSVSGGTFGAGNISAGGGGSGSAQYVEDPSGVVFAMTSGDVGSAIGNSSFDMSVGGFSGGGSGPITYGGSGAPTSIGVGVGSFSLSASTPGFSLFSAGSVSGAFSLSSGAVNTTGLTVDATVPGFSMFATIPFGTLLHHHLVLSTVVTLTSVPIPALPITSLPGSGAGSGTCSGTGTITGSGAISASAGTNGTPPAWEMQCWFRI